MSQWVCDCGWSCPATPAGLRLILLHDERGGHQVRRDDQPVIPAKNEATR